MKGKKITGVTIRDLMVLTATAEAVHKNAMRGLSTNAASLPFKSDDVKESLDRVNNALKRVKIDLRNKPQ